VLELQEELRQPPRPHVTVTIERVEVRAIVAQQGIPPARRPSRAPAMSLESYLERRHGVAGR
jgi:hypothetical protein